MGIKSASGWPTDWDCRYRSARGTTWPALASPARRATPFGCTCSQQSPNVTHVVAVGRLCSSPRSSLAADNRLWLFSVSSAYSAHAQTAMITLCPQIRWNRSHGRRESVASHWRFMAARPSAPRRSSSLVTVPTVNVVRPSQCQPRAARACLPRGSRPDYSFPTSTARPVCQRPVRSGISSKESKTPRLCRAWDCQPVA
jgi:hypothetical protein